MSKSVSAAEMRELDRRAIEEFGIPSLLLMENAGRGISEVIHRNYHGKRICILVGKGNNGGDGLVVARHLWNHDFQVLVLLFADPEKLNPDPAVNYGIVSKMMIPCEVVTEKTDHAWLRGYFERSDVVVDALFGVGLSQPLTGIFEMGVKLANEIAKSVVAVDIPSGLDADTGEVLGCAMKATLTATLGLPKHGLFQGEGPRYAGRVCVVDIGLPKQIL
ncbi:MAG: NAD(P)H-hydrate epimerase [Candidatus Omnitrophica bacterium]|nr:NAD(P)H-hydrate epimerase [Candidatus Omnitrophota bacterium]